ncbi:restriction endonuclease, partial [Pseudomonas syringae pv. pisi str. 1704B]
IEEAGTSFRVDLALFFYYVWENDIDFPEMQFNRQAATIAGQPF